MIKKPLRYLVVIISCTVLRNIWAQYDFKPWPATSTRPFYLGWPLKRELQYVTMNRMILNMTAELCKDAELRIRLADIVQNYYKGSLSFELGTISAAVKDIFKRMINNYRFYKNNSRMDLDTLILGLYVMEGDYNDIRMEKGLYYDVLRTHRQKHEVLLKGKQAMIDKMKQAFIQNAKSKPRRRDTRLTTGEEERYKKALRYKSWAKKWANFSPEIEGIDININDPMLIL